MSTPDPIQQSEEDSLDYAEFCSSQSLWVERHLQQRTERRFLESRNSLTIYLITVPNFHRPEPALQDSEPPFIKVIKVTYRLDSTTITKKKKLFPVPHHINILVESQIVGEHVDSTVSTEAAVNTILDEIQLFFKPPKWFNLPYASPRFGIITVFRLSNGNDVDEMISEHQRKMVQLDTDNTATMGNGGLSPRKEPMISRDTSLDALSNSTSQIDHHISSTSSHSRSSFKSAKSTFSSSISTSNRSSRVHTIEEGATSLGNNLQAFYNEYSSVLERDEIIEPFDTELNWSGKGQHVAYMPGAPLPLRVLGDLGIALYSRVDKVLCRRIALARKRMTCNRRWSIGDAMREVNHLRNIRHAHIVQLVGSYLQGREFSILIYPVADCHLGTFLEDTADLDSSLGPSLEPREPFDRKNFLLRSFVCLASALKYIHDRTTKHMDIKPQNILVKQKSDLPTWSIYIADFGLSRNFQTEDHSQTDESTYHSPRYCSPEVSRRARRGRAADIFSLGCVFAEMWTVLWYRHPQDFADYRKGDSENISFCANLPRVLGWLETLTMDCLSLDEYDPRICSLIGSMLQEDPAQRPKASELLRSIRESITDSETIDQDCCGAGPEPYVAYSPKPSITEE